jgi:carboxymethylenebutenolidase
MRHYLLASFLIAGLAAQDPPPPPPPSSPPIAGTADLDEKAFAALHDLKQEQPPKPTGVMVKVGDVAHYLALPKDQKAPLPAILVIHEWWGLNDHIKHWADRLAADGYAALAVDLYGGTPATTREEAQAAMAKVDAEQARATLRAAFAFLGSDERVRATRRACLGWCFGGAWSLQLAIAEPKLDACVLYYGRLVEDEAQLAAIRAPVLGVFGTRDRSIPEARVATFEAAMKRLGKDVTVRRYDAEHAFANPSGARYDAKHAAAAWAEARAFLRTHLTAPKAPASDTGK